MPDVWVWIIFWKMELGWTQPIAICHQRFFGLSKLYTGWLNWLALVRHRNSHHHTKDVDCVLVQKRLIEAGGLSITHGSDNQLLKYWSRILNAEYVVWWKSATYRLWHYSTFLCRYYEIKRIHLKNRCERNFTSVKYCYIVQDISGETEVTVARRILIKPVICNKKL